MLAPDAVISTELPEHIVAEPDGTVVMVGNGLTVTLILSFPVQPAVVPVTVYVVVDAGLAVTGVPVVADKPAAGPHEYVVAPPALSTTPAPPAQSVVEPVGVIVTVGPGLTVILTESFWLPHGVTMVTV